MTLALLRPSEEDIQKVMKETGMEYIQAYNHVKARLYLQKVVIPNTRWRGESSELA